jgi:1-acyl-sn-glycerol-3-phosphate acyltransferase
MTDRHSAGNPLWIAYEYVTMVCGLGGLAIICLAWLPFAMILNPLLPRRVGLKLGRFMAMAGFRFYLAYLSFFFSFRFELDSLDALHDEAGPLIIAANHPSLLDAVMIISRLPNAVCVMKASLMDNVLFGAAARLAGYIRNNEPLELILNARDGLEEGAHLLIFPEGTRTVDFPVDHCSASTALIAWRTQTPVQTLLIDFSTPYLGKAWPLFRPPQLPLDCRVRLGRRFPPPTNVEDFTAELEAYFRAEVEMGESLPTAATLAV